MTKICVVGLGYVGLPLALAFSKKFDTVGFDLNQKKILEFKQGIDATNEVDNDDLKNTNAEFTSDTQKISECDFIIVAVPTPIEDDEDHTPDVSYLESASEIVGKNLSKGSIVVYESTVYPGVTEDICVPVLEKHSAMKCGTDFKVGYSPERVNPGDKQHTVDKIIKVVSGMDEESLNKIADTYSKIITAGVYKAKDIKTAEAAKVIENIQRDLNIALMNELSLIFEKMGINTLDVIQTAGTKWNFHKYSPGLVGGHCIGIDPYYLAYKAKLLDYLPKVILAGREINEYMPVHVANTALTCLKKSGKEASSSKVYILGLTFKENVPDPRNSKAKVIINHLQSEGVDVKAYDPMLEDETVENLFGVKNTPFDSIGEVDLVILITPHTEFKSITLDKLKKIMKKPILIDVKSFYNKDEAKNKGFIYKSL